MKQGIYCFKRLVMGAGPASQEFHKIMRRQVAGIEGVIQIEDDLLVYGVDQAQYDKNLQHLMARLQEVGVTLRFRKCAWRVNQVIWFRYQFEKEAMSADPAKIKAVTSLPPPATTTEVKSFLQMCQCNALFMFDKEQKYSDITAPLRSLV